MAEFSDVAKALVESTKTGQIEWQIGTDSGGYWHCSCDGMRFQVRLTGMVEVFGNVPSMQLGTSPELLEALQQCKPFDSELIPTREEVLERALECLRHGKGE